MALDLQTAKIQMRQPIINSIIWAYTVCPLVFEFWIWCACTKQVLKFADVNFVICFSDALRDKLKHIQLNFKGLNTFGTMEIYLRQG